MNLRRAIFLAIVVLTNAALWIVPSDVVELVARDKHTLLGRYSREHMSWNIAALIFAMVGFYIDWAPPEKYRKRWFQVVATLLFITPAVLVLDFLARSPEREHYVRESLAYHRPANTSFTVQYSDRPEARRSYPNASPGFGTNVCVYDSDSRGFRNRTDSEQYDVVVLGDSFVEGSRVSDDEPWAVRLAEESGLTVCNLGMSGYSVVHYLACLKEYGLPLSPRYVLCMLYEGNDFRVEDVHAEIEAPGISKRLKTYFKQSPLRAGLDKLLIETLGPIGADWKVEGLDILSWLPVPISHGPDTSYYAFAPKQLLQNKESRDLFRMNRPWRGVADLLQKMKGLCEDADAELILVFAPTKAHVVLPLARDRLPAEKVHAFAALRADLLPEPDVFMEKLFSNLSARESVLAEWCAQNAVTFVGTTEALRERAASGQQVYYTYDQHWTPIGHRVVARTVFEYGLSSALRKSGERLNDAAAAFSGEPKGR